MWKYKEIFFLNRSDDWYADCGTQHKKNQKSILINFPFFAPENWKVSGIGGTKLVVEGMGDVLITSYVNGHPIQGPFFLHYNTFYALVLKSSFVNIRHPDRSTLRTRTRDQPLFHWYCDSRWMGSAVYRGHGHHLS